MYFSQSQNGQNCPVRSVCELSREEGPSRSAPGNPRQPPSSKGWLPLYPGGRDYAHKTEKGEQDCCLQGVLNPVGDSEPRHESTVGAGIQDRSGVGEPSRGDFLGQREPLLPPTRLWLQDTFPKWLCPTRHFTNTQPAPVLHLFHLLRTFWPHYSLLGLCVIELEESHFRSLTQAGQGREQSLQSPVASGIRAIPFHT